MYFKKNKTMMNSLLIVLVGMLLVMPMKQIQAQTISTSESHARDSAWLDATDRELFGDHALEKESNLDQSEKLQAIIDQSQSLTNQVYIPAGVYILNETVTLRSGLKLKGDPLAPTIFKNTTNKNVTLSDENYQTSHNIEITHFFFEGVGIFTRRANNIVINDNVFYHPVSVYPINLQASVDAVLQNNIFMRDHEHATPNTENRAIYVGGFATSGLYEYMENVQISDNLFGLRINELDAIKSFSNDPIIRTIDRLQDAIRSEKITFTHNDQNYLSCGVNSYNNVKGALIKNNFFQQMYENEDRYGVVGDHAIYLRGSQDVQVIGNHVRGLHNGPYGGFKFKSGRDITIMNNYLRNTGLILYETPEFGLGDNFAQGTVAELSNILVANNIFDFKEWQDRFAIGMEYNRHTGVDNVFNGVFIDNHFVNYHNIPANRRRELLIMNSDGEGFKGATTFVSGNTRDDTENKVLHVEYWSPEDYNNMPTLWTDLINPTVYERYKDSRTPTSNTLPIGRQISLFLGEFYDPFDFVEQTHDSDDEKPTITLLNQEVLTKIGQHRLEIMLSYNDGRKVHVFSEVTIQDKLDDTEPPNLSSKAATTEGQITFLPNYEELVVIPPESNPEVVIPPEVPGSTGPFAIAKAITMDFGTQYISTKDQRYEMIAETADLANEQGKHPYVSFVQVQDLSGTNRGWTLNLSLSDFKSNTLNNKLIGAQIELLNPRIQYEGNNELNAPSSNGSLLQLKPGTGSINLMTARTGTGAGTSSLVFGDQVSLNRQYKERNVDNITNNNISLTIPGETLKDSTTYVSSLEWELLRTPDNNQGYHQKQ